MSKKSGSDEDGETKYVKVQEKRLKLTHLDKVLYPEAGFTKAEVIDYYARIAPTMLSHLKNRPLTLKRYPNGTDKDFFYEKHCPSHRPRWMETIEVSGEDKTVNFCRVNNLPSLIWVANLASLEMHTSLSLSKDLSRPTMMVFDLDPGPPATLLQCLEVAVKLRELFEEYGLESFPKTSGGKGLHLYVPLNTPVTYDETKSSAREFARLMEKRHERLVTANMRKELRKGKVFIDWSQNDHHKTTVCAYSLRARGRPTVSAPVQWKECEKALKRSDPSMLVWEAEGMLKRVERQGDLFEPVLSLKQKLPSL
ncbi:MAG TPA: non-homologous end-joining DNA ligase [Desulfomonilaceae bacterium]|nr:non-homologous end-joining DNA ligase [Desulfomonilaceae bacterium]